MEKSTLKIEINDILDKVIIDIRVKRLKGNKIEIIIPCLNNNKNGIKKYIDISLNDNNPLVLKRKGFTFIIYNDYYNDKEFSHYNNIYYEYDNKDRKCCIIGSFRIDYKIIKDKK